MNMENADGWLKLSEAVTYVKEVHKLNRTRQSIYNWIKVGIKGVKLQTEERHDLIMTTKQWVDDFINDAGVQEDSDG